MPDQAPPAYPRRWLTLAVLALSPLVIVVDTTIVNVAIPTFAVSLYAGATALEWIVDAYTLVFAALLPAGSMGDRYGLGVAAVGSIAATGYTHVMKDRSGSRSIGAAAAIARHLDSTAAHTLHTHAANAFVHGAALGLAISACSPRSPPTGPSPAAPRDPSGR
ncbi:hypothetical protein [Actinoallomurus acaciae]|uniref:MFS transporter n=1 Tax=Actinoallomurus acaciae TaxID=502577 RepID=A0ABV5YRY5_9ACTN